MRKLKVVCAAALMIRSRTRSPGAEQPGPVLAGAVAVDQECVGRLGHVGDVGRVHPHPGEHVALFRGHRLLAAAQPTEQRRLLAVEEAAFLLEPGEDRVRVEEAPVRQDDHMLAVIGDRVGAGRIDDQRAVMPDLLLQAGMAVIPVGARLLERELVGEGRARLDAREADARHAVHLESARSARASGSRCPRPGGCRRSAGRSGLRAAGSAARGWCR